MQTTVTYILQRLTSINYCNMQTTATYTFSLVTILRCSTNISKSKFTFIGDHSLQFLSTFFYVQNPARFGPPYYQARLISSDRVCWLEAISRDRQMLNGRACIVSSYCDANRAGWCQTILITEWIWVFGPYHTPVETDLGEPSTNIKS